MKLGGSTVLKRVLDVVLIGAMVYAALLAFGVIRRGGRFEEGRPAPDFKAISVADGKEVALSDFRGKAVLINFFSTGCPSCKRELPHVEEFAENARGGLEVLLVSSDPPEELRAFMAGRSSRIRTLYDPGAAQSSYRVDTIPYLVVVDPQGTIRGDYIGSIKWSDVEPYLPVETSDALENRFIGLSRQSSTRDETTATLSSCQSGNMGSIEAETRCASL